LSLVCNYTLGMAAIAHKCATRSHLTFSYASMN
jgi:hypothetical protein